MNLGGREAIAVELNDDTLAVRLGKLDCQLTAKRRFDALVQAVLQSAQFIDERGVPRSLLDQHHAPLFVRISASHEVNYELWRCNHWAFTVGRSTAQQNTFDGSLGYDFSLEWNVAGLLLQNRGALPLDC